MGKTANHTELVHDLGVVGHQLTDTNTGKRCRNRLIGPTDFACRIRFQVKGVELRRATVLPNEDDRTFAPLAGAFSCQQVTERAAKKTQRPHCDELAARERVAKRP